MLGCTLLEAPVVSSDLELPHSLVTYPGVTLDVSITPNHFSDCMMVIIKNVGE